MAEKLNMKLEYRSDTFTQPTEEMREAMKNAKVGDDVYGEDPTVNELEAFAAGLVGKEAAIFLPTCTMANLIAVSVHCTPRFSEIIIGDQQHIHRYESGGIAAISGVHHRTVPNNADGSLPLDLVKKYIRETDIHFPHTKVICVENTNNICGGTVLKLDFLENLRKVANERDLKVHMDGARLFNAVAALKSTPEVICKTVDSVSICLSKGLCCPAGALLVGSKDFIKESRHMRKALGGGMRQSGVLAACGLYALKHLTSRMVDDHVHAKKLAVGLENLNPEKGNKIFSVFGGVDAVETNMFYVTIRDGKAKELVQNLREEHNIFVDCYGTEMIRVVTHRDVPLEHADYTLQSFSKVMKKIYSA